ncbi:nicotinate (nicotinamide) nucleotide adenylyltransferase [Phycisphaerales bacterium AB-hyl4]|uniref:Probable nicotinate-nucleotide adenylyltransferase n=1 Tax=Natronomicrosphaera hydrolytica TaxID=3242702 RepID=A0ABV4U9Z6_9BACT
MTQPPAPVTLGMPYTAPMDLTRCRNVIIFGGSFDPPQRAHVELPEQVRRAIHADVVAYMPAARSPLKLGRRQASAEHRLNMLRLALADRPHTVVLTDELDRAADGRPSYTVDTLEALRRRLPAEVQLRLLIGADQVYTFDQWHRAARVIELAQPIVMVRPPDTRATLLDALTPTTRQQWEPRLVAVDAMPISSTMVRESVQRNEPIDDLVPAPVARYIAEHDLYRE